MTPALRIAGLNLRSGLMEGWICSLSGSKPKKSVRIIFLWSFSKQLHCPGNFLRCDLAPELLHFFHQPGEPDGFGRADPFELEPFRPYCELFHFSVNFLDTFNGPLVGVYVVAVADVAAADKNYRRSFCQSLPYERLVHAARAHGPDQPNGSRILQA